MKDENIEENKEKVDIIKNLTIPNDMQFGIEIESDGPSKFNILKESFFNDLGWKTIIDSNLSEVISPILNGGTKQNTQRIYQICRKLQKMGQHSSLKGGAHVHISNKYLDSIAAIQNLMDIWCNCEKIMFCISNPPGEITRQDGVYYAYPISKMLYQNYNKLIRDNSEEYSECEKYEMDITSTANKYDPYASSEMHYRALNLYTIHHTFEFRIANSTVNPETWIENINLFGGIIKAAKELTDIQKKPKKQRTQEENYKIACLYKINDDSISEQKRLEALLNLDICKEERNIYLERYLKNLILLKENQQLEKSLMSKISEGKIHYNQTSYKESMELDGLEDIEEVKHRVNILIQEYIMAKNSSYRHDADFFESNFYQVDQFVDSYLSLRHMGFEEDLYKNLDLSSLDYNGFRNKTFNFFKQKQKELIEKHKQEEQNKQKNGQFKEKIAHESKEIQKNIIDLYEDLKQIELSATNASKRLELTLSMYGIEHWELLDTINTIKDNMQLISDNAQSNENLSENFKTLKKFYRIENIIDNSNFSREYSKELRDNFEKEFNEKIQKLIKKSKIDRLNSEKQIIKNEKVSFIERILGKGKLQKAKIDNIELRKKIENNKDKKEKANFEDSLSDLYSSVKNELGGVYTPEIKEFLKRVNNEPYVMNNVNIENMKSQIARKSKEYTQKGKEYLIPVKGGFKNIKFRLCY